MLAMEAFMVGGFGAAGDGVAEKVDVLEPDDALAAEHGDGLHALAEAVHGGFDFGDVAGETADDLAGILVGDFGGQGVETLLAEAADEEVVRTADKGEFLVGRHGSAHLAGKGRRAHEKNRHASERS